MKRIFFVVYEPANAEVGLMLAERGRASGAYDVVMWSPYGLPNAEATAARATAAGSVYIQEYTATGGLADIWTPVSGWLTSKPHRLPVDEDAASVEERRAIEATLADLVEAWGEAGRERLLSVRRAADADLRRMAFCEDMLVRLGVDALVLAEDNVERDSHAWIRAARRRAIPSTVVTYGTLSPTEAENAYRRSPAHAVEPLERGILARRLGRWLRVGPDYAITRLPLEQALGRELAGFVTRDPWLVNTGAVDRIAVESEGSRAAYLAAGFDAERVITTGHLFHDRLARDPETRASGRAALAERHGLSLDRPWLVVAMPPNQCDHRPVDRDAGFPDLVRRFCDLPAEITGFEVVVSPHPNLLGPDRELVRSAQGTLVEVPVADLLGLADAYLACVSSTISWALALGLPTIDYDCYRYRYEDKAGEPGLVTARDADSLVRALRALADPSERERWRSASAARASWWGLTDGLASDRIVDLVLSEATDAGRPSRVQA